MIEIYEDVKDADVIVFAYGTLCLKLDAIFIVQLTLLNNLSSFLSV